jgi:hypothetical protein
MPPALLNFSKIVLDLHANTIGILYLGNKFTLKIVFLSGTYIFAIAQFLSNN